MSSNKSICELITYMRNDRKIVIVNSPTYCGGTIVLSHLCRCLCQIGYDARILTVPYFPSGEINKKIYWKQVLLYNYKVYRKVQKEKKQTHRQYRHLHNIKFELLPSFSDDAIVVYPEVVWGNPLNAKNVVRWLLYHYQFKNQEGAYSNSDLFICYRDVFNDIDLNPQKKTIQITHFDSELYKQVNFSSRTIEKCYILRKGKNRKDLPSVIEGPIIDDLTEEEIVDVFNNSRYCYSYDTQTFYVSIAAVCGCVPIVVMEPGKFAKDYLSESELTHYGVAFGETQDQIEYAIDTRKELLKQLDFSNDNLENTYRFIMYLKDYFPKYRSSVPSTLLFMKHLLGYTIFSSIKMIINNDFNWRAFFRKFFHCISVFVITEALLFI